MSVIQCKLSYNFLTSDFTLFTTDKQKISIKEDATNSDLKNIIRTSNVLDIINLAAVTAIPIQSQKIKKRKERDNVPVIQHELFANVNLHAESDSANFPMNSDLKKVFKTSNFLDVINLPAVAFVPKFNLRKLIRDGDNYILCCMDIRELKFPCRNSLSQVGNFLTLFTKYIILQSIHIYIFFISSQKLLSHIRHPS